jgi:YHS domain-containing protein
MRTKTQCFTLVCDFIQSQTSLYEAIKSGANWQGDKESSKLSVVEAVNYWYASHKYRTEFSQNPIDFFTLNYGTWLKFRIKKGGQK